VIPVSGFFGEPCTEVLYGYNVVEMNATGMFDTKKKLDGSQSHLLLFVVNKISK
jgi:hypothetical protein